MRKYDKSELRSFVHLYYHKMDTLAIFKKAYCQIAEDHFESTCALVIEKISWYIIELGSQRFCLFYYGVETSIKNEMK